MRRLLPRRQVDRLEVRPREDGRVDQHDERRRRERDRAARLARDRQRGPVLPAGRQLQRRGEHRRVVVGPLRIQEDRPPVDDEDLAPSPSSRRAAAARSRTRRRACRRRPGPRTARSTSPSARASTAGAGRPATPSTRRSPSPGPPRCARPESTSGRRASASRPRPGWSPSRERSAAARRSRRPRSRWARTPPLQPRTLRPPPAAAAATRGRNPRDDRMRILLLYGFRELYRERAERVSASPQPPAASGDG